MRSSIIKLVLALILLLPASFSFAPGQDASAAPSALAAPTLNSPADGATGVSTSPALDVTVTGPEGDPLTVTFYGRPVPGQPGQDFTLVALPDTQGYTDKNNSDGDIFDSQTQWIVANRASLNIAYVAHLGDVVQHNDSYPVEWQTASTAMGFLEDPATTGLPDGIPYGIAFGNNDGSGTLYNQYFGLSRFEDRSYYGDHYGSNNNNHYSLFSAGGMNFIVIDFQYDSPPAAAVLSWANQVLQANSSRRAIVVAHDIIASTTTAAFSSSGQAIYNALKNNPNLFLMLSGHVGGEAWRQDTYNGSTVYSLLSDYQYKNNGNLRIMRFSPANNEIQVETYSPWLHLYETDADSQFTLSYPMGGATDFVEIGTAPNVSSGSNASVTWPGLSGHTEYEWYVKVSDGSQTTTSSTWTFTTGDLILPPVAAGDNYSTNQDTPLEIEAPGVLDNDSSPEGNPLTAMKVSGPSHGSLLFNSDGSFTYTPLAGFHGSDSFKYKVTDSESTSLPATVTIQVNGKPVAVNDSFTMNQGSPLAVPVKGVLSNDTDPEGETLTASLVSDPSSGILNSFNSNGSFTYTPLAGFHGTDSFQYNVTDGELTSNPATVTIQVNGKPVAVNDSYMVNYGSTLTVPAKGVLANDTDPEGSPLTAVRVSGPAYGSLVLNTNGSFTYTPQTGYYGEDSFTYKASDGKAESDTALVTITIVPPGAPQAADNIYSTLEDNPLSIGAPGVLEGDSSPDEKELSAVLSKDPSYGHVILNPDGSFTYTPDSNFNGRDSFTYQASDGVLLSAEAEVSIDILAVNDAPSAVGDVYTTIEDTPRSLSLRSPGSPLDNDTDVEGDKLEITNVSSTSGGEAALTTSSIIFTPVSDLCGPAAAGLDYTVSDGKGGVGTGHIQIDITCVNDPPIAANDSYTAYGGTTFSAAVPGVLSNDSDIDQDSLKAVLVSSPSYGSLSLNLDGSFVYTPNEGFTGFDSFTYQASDGSLISNTATVNLQVREPQIYLYIPFLSSRKITSYFTVNP